MTRYTRRVLDHGTRGGRGAQKVLIGAGKGRGKVREGAIGIYRYNDTCLHVMMLHIIGDCHPISHIPPQVPPLSPSLPLRTPRLSQNASWYYNADKMFCPSITVFFLKRDQTRYYLIEMVDKGTKKSQMEYIMAHKRGTSVGAFKDYRIDRNKYV